MSKYIPIVIIFLFVVLFLGAYFFWWPKYLETKDLRVQLENKEEDLRKREAYLSELNDISKKLSDEHSDAINKINWALPADNLMPALFNFVLKTASENGLVVDDIGWKSSAQKDSNVQDIPLSISVSGSYSSLKNFLTALYKSARLVEVDSINFSSPSKGEMFDAKISLRVRIYKD